MKLTAASILAPVVISWIATAKSRCVDADVARENVRRLLSLMDTPWTDSVVDHHRLRSRRLADWYLRVGVLGTPLEGR